MSTSESVLKLGVIRSVALAATGVAILSVPAAHAQVTPYQDVDAFLSDLGGSFNLEDYESFDVCTTLIPDGAVMNDVTYNYLGDFGIVDGLVGDTYNQLGLNSLYYDKDGLPGCDASDYFYPGWGDKVVVTFPTPVTAVGMHFSVGASDTLTDYCIIETSAGNATSGGTADLNSPPFSSLFFVGLISDEPFNSATIYCRAGAPTGFNLDNLYWAGSCPADFNGDGVINTLDFLAFLNAFNEGC